ncbi:MAG: TOBE domain-containing protein, partial [Burkholderiaceae bacterium]|nr:TOBE domain-containing protein [Burkholderiaceae bacterium]
SNLDAALRGQTRVEIHNLHRDLGATTIYVTHDQVEAMTLADRIVVLRDGQIEQVGTPLELYDRPANQFVAQFIGSPRMNVIEARQVPGVAGVPADGFIGLRPEDVTLKPAGEGGLPGRVELIEALGSETLIHVTIDSGAQLIARQATRSTLHNGDRVGVFVAAANAHRFDAQGRATRAG